jgi:hypothetical protein
MLSTAFYELNIASSDSALYTRIIGLLVFSSDIQIVRTNYSSYNQLAIDLISLNKYYSANDGTVDIAKYKY